MFYSLSNTNEPNQASIVAIKKKYDSPNPLRVLSFSEFPLEPLVFPEFYIQDNEVYKYVDDDISIELESRQAGVESDFMYNYGSIGGKGFILSEKAKTVLEEFSLGFVKFYPIEVYTQQEIPTRKKYYYMQVLNSNYKDWIDYPNSKFYLYNANALDYTKRIVDIDVSNKEMLTEIYNNRPPAHSLRCDKIAFKRQEYDKWNFDLFFMREVYLYIVISKRLKNKLEEAGITGLEPFVPLTAINIVNNS